MLSNIHKYTNEVSNYKGNVKRDLQWAVQTKLAQPWTKFRVGISGRNYILDDLQVKQKAKLKQLFIQAFNNEQKDLLPIRKAEQQSQLLAQGVENKHIEKVLKSIKKESFKKDSSRVTNHYFLKQISEFIEEEKVKSANCKTLFGKHKEDTKLCFVRKGRVVSLFQEGYFKSIFQQTSSGTEISVNDNNSSGSVKDTDDPISSNVASSSASNNSSSKATDSALATTSDAAVDAVIENTIAPVDKEYNSNETISWEEFKTEVFYNYINKRNSILESTQREKRIIKLIDSAWEQLQSERKEQTDPITYSQMSARLKSFSHGIDSSFFEQSFWTDKADQPIVSLKKFKQDDCGIIMSRADVYQMIIDLKNEQTPANHFDEKTVQLGSQALEADKKADADAAVALSPKSTVSTGLFSRLFANDKDDDVQQQTRDSKVSSDAEEENPLDLTSETSKSVKDDGELDEEKLREISVNSINSVNDNNSSSTTTSSSAPQDNNNNSNDDGDNESEYIIIPIQAYMDANLQVSDLLTEKAQQMLQSILADFANTGSQSSQYLKNSMLKTQDECDEYQDILSTTVDSLEQECEDKTSGLNKLLSKSSTIEQIKADYQSKIAIATKNSNDFAADAEKLQQYLRTVYRYSLTPSRIQLSNNEIASSHGCWKDAVHECGENNNNKQKNRDDSVFSGTKPSVRFTTAGAHVEFKEKHPVILPVTLEKASVFEKKKVCVQEVFVVEKSNINLPSCVDYGTEFPPICEAQQQNHPGCIEAICALKEWQEYKSTGKYQKLSVDYMCKALSATHSLNEKAVNVCVDATVWDALSLCSKDGLPTDKDFKDFYEKSKSKKAEWVRQLLARFKVTCRNIMIDRVCLVNGIEQIKIALACYGPLLCSAPVVNAHRTKWFEKHKNNDNNTTTTTTETVQGYHTMLLVGYDDHQQTLKFKNFLGMDYGDFGYLQITYDDFTKGQFCMILCEDRTLPKHAGRVSAQNLQHQKEEKYQQQQSVDKDCIVALAADSHHRSVKSTSNEDIKVKEDYLIRNAQKHAVGYLHFTHKKQTLISFSFSTFDIVLLNFPSRIENPQDPNNPFTLLIPQQTGVALVGFAANEAIQAWSTDAKGYYLFANQTTHYRNNPNDDLFKVTFYTNNKRWSLINNNENFKCTGLVTVLNIATGQEVLKRIIQLTIANNENSPHVMSIAL